MPLHRHLRQAIAALSTFPIIEFRLGPLKDSLFRPCRVHGYSSSKKRDDAAPLVTSARYVRRPQRRISLPVTGLLRRQARLNRGERAVRAQRLLVASRRLAFFVCCSRTTRDCCLLMRSLTRFNGRERHLRRSFTTRAKPALRHRFQCGGSPAVAGSRGRHTPPSCGRQDRSRGTRPVDRPGAPSSHL